MRGASTTVTRKPRVDAAHNRRHLVAVAHAAFAAEGLEPVYFGNGELDIERMIAEQEGMTLEEATYQEDE